MNNFDGLKNFDAMYEAQNEENNEKKDALDAKENQIEGLISQLKTDKKDLSKRLERSYTIPTEDSAGILMDLQVIEKRLDFNLQLQKGLFGDSK